MSRPENTDAVYTLADLASWRGAGEGAVSLAVLGKPVAHSASPAMHNAALAQLSRAQPQFGQWRYYKFEVAPENLAEALARFKEANFKGLNLTLPHKVEAMKLLGSQCAGAQARAAGAANTLVADGNAWRLENTDIEGLRWAVENALGAPLKGAHVVVLGTGGAARAAVACAAQNGARAVEVRSRARERACSFASSMKGVCPVVCGGDARAHFPQNAILINATPLGLKAEDGTPTDSSLLRADVRVFDMTYGKSPNALARACAAVGAPYADGLPMLAAQGAEALALWTGCAADAVRAAMLAAAKSGLSLS